MQPPKGDPKGSNKLTFSNGREDNLTGKCVYFARVNPKGVTAKDVETDVTYGEIVGTPLGSLQSILQDVFQVISHLNSMWHGHEGCKIVTLSW